MSTTKGLSPSAPMTHLAYLDALRGVAVLMVISVHCGIVSGQTGLAYMLTVAGQRGVALFYVVSAFTLYRSLDLRQDGWADFFVRRFFRIAPMFYLCLLISLSLGADAPIYASRHMTGFDVAAALAFINGFYPRGMYLSAAGGWSVAIEAIFYALLPILYSRVRTLKQSLWLFILAAPVCEYVSYHVALHQSLPQRQQFFAFLSFPVQFPVFVLGIVAYQLWNHFGAWMKSLGEDDRRVLSLVLLIASVIMFLATLPITDATLYYSAAAFVPLILSLALQPWRLLVNPVLGFLGRISYSLYLLHFYVLLLLHKFRQAGHLGALQGERFGFFVYVALVLAMTVPVATLSFHLIELPGTQMGRRIIRSFSGRYSLKEDAIPVS